MQSFDYEAMVYDGEVYCVGCLPDGVSEEDAEPIFAGSEWDYAPSCCVCHAKHDYMSILDSEEES